MFHLLTRVLQIIAYIREDIKKNNILEQTMIGLIWSSIMSSVEWNKKEELVTEQAIKHLKVTFLLLYVALLFIFFCGQYDNTLGNGTSEETCGYRS